MKKYFYLFCLCGLFAGLFGSCGDDVYETYVTEPSGRDTLVIMDTLVIRDTVVLLMPDQGLSLATDYTMEMSESMVFKAVMANTTLETTYSWLLNTEEVSTDSVYVFTPEQSGSYVLSLTATNSEGKYTQSVNITVNPGKYKHGTFILNEGLIGTHGSLIYISPSGEITPNVYHAVNGKYLWGLTQDMFIRHNKIYIISQGGDISASNYGGLTVLNAETLKEEYSYSFPRGSVSLSTPGHIAVLGEDEIYIQSHGEQGRIYLFHPSDSSLTEVANSRGAYWNTMAVASNKVFVPVNRDSVLMVIENGAAEVSRTIQFRDLVSGVIRSSDGNLWVSDNSGTIYKVDPNTCQIIDKHTLTLEGAAEALHRNPSSRKASTPHISAKGDTIYINNTDWTIYCHIFSQNLTLTMVDTRYYIPEDDDYFTGQYSMGYNTCAVDPVSGEVYFNSLKGIGGQRHWCHTSVFDFSWAGSGASTYVTVRKSRDYAGYIDYPAGVYFTHNFLELEKAEEAFINQ